MAISKIILNGVTQMDVTNITATEADVAQGKTFLLADGTIGTGTNTGGGSEPTYVTYFNDSTTTASDKTISIPSLSSLYFASGETWRVTWDGTEYTCYPNVHEGWLWYIGNHGLTDGTDDGTGEPFCLYNYGGSALNGVARTAGTHTLKLEKQTSTGGTSATLITKEITANGTYNASDDSADGYSSVVVNVPSGSTPTLQTKSVTPTESEQTVTADSGYDGLSSVTVNAIPSEYITTTDATASASDIVSGATAYVNGSKVTGSLVINKYYTGSSAPSSSLGNDGDIYLKVVS